MAAESSRGSVTRRDPTAASMRPRPNGRGKPDAAPEPRVVPISFNEAAAKWPRKEPWAADADGAVDVLQ
jgi:hypothetical protein